MKKTMQKKDARAPKERKINNNKIFAGVAIGVSALVVALVVTLIVVISKSNKVDYIDGDLSKYVYISPEDYKDFSVDIAIREPDATDIEFEIIKALTAYCERVDEGAYKKEGTLGAADRAYIYYLGYTLDEQGRKIQFNGGCNFDDDTPYFLQLGTGRFVSGFEYNLIGKQIEDYNKFSKITSGTVEEDQIIYLSYARIEGNDIRYHKSYRLDLSSDVDSIMGAGFREAILGKEIGKDLEPITTALGNTALSYYSLKVNYATKCEDNPITIEAHFPHDYGVEFLNAKTVYFDVYVEKFIDYTVPEYNDAFITEKLEIAAEDLEEYDGTTLAEKYRSFIAKTLADEYETNKQSLIDDKIWDHLIENTEIIKYPSENVKEQYEIYYDELQELYEKYGSSYDSFGAYVRARYSLSESADWQAYLELLAKESVAQKMLFYYVIRAEGWMPEGAEYERLYNEAVEEALADQLVIDGCKRENYSSDEAYNSAVSEIRRKLVAAKGETYFTDIVYFEYGMKCINEHVTATNTLEGA